MKRKLIHPVEEWNEIYEPGNLDHRDEHKKQRLVALFAHNERRNVGEPHRKAKRDGKDDNAVGCL